MAFQVADDYLDAYGDEKVFGKPIGGDILNGKKSWLTVHALALAPDKRRLQAALDAPAATEAEKAAKISAVTAMYDALGVPGAALAEIRRHTDEALSSLSAMGLGPVRMEALRRFAFQLVGRVK